MKKIKAGIIGGAGYTGGELLRLLLRHPDIDLAFVHSKSNAGNPLHAAHPDLLGETELRFSDSIQTDIDVMFLCLGHGDSKVFLAETLFPDAVKIIDLSQDFRIKSPESEDFVYGLTEMNTSQIREAQRLANPGCFATAIQLALLPLADGQLLRNDIHISAITGSTGAGQSLTPTSHFSWRNNNISIYKAFQHQHLKEITQSVQSLQPDFDRRMNFIPFRGNFTRGILASVYLDIDISINRAIEIYREYYQESPFVHISDSNPDIKQVVNTNNAILHLDQHNGTLHIISAIDNLLKGASGQAVQNMNLMFNIPETSGLRLKASAF